jgi:hypothetical protein
MPAKSARQYGLMQAALHGGSSAVPKSVAREFVEKTPAKKRKKFAQSLMHKKSKKEKY